MKKLLALLLACMMMLALVACGGGDNPTSDKNEENGGNGGNSTPTEQKEKITFTEQTVVDNDQYIIKITGIDPDDILGYSLKIYVENKSADTTYTFSTDSAYINGVNNEPIFYLDLEPGKKANDEITFLTNEMEENGVGDFTDIEMTFRVRELDNYDDEAAAYYTTNIYPYGKEKAVKFERKSVATDTVLVDNADVTVIVLGYEKPDSWGLSIPVYVVNKTDKELSFSWDDESVNGYMIEGFGSSVLKGGKCDFYKVEWLKSDFEENSITDVEEIEFLLKITDFNDWEADPILEQNITLNP